MASFPKNISSDFFNELQVAIAEETALSKEVEQKINTLIQQNPQWNKLLGDGHFEIDDAFLSQLNLDPTSDLSVALKACCVVNGVMRCPCTQVTAVTEIA